MIESKTLIEAIRFFSKPQNCIDTVAAMRWVDGKPVCPNCAGLDHYWLATQSRWKCRACKRQFSVKAGTVMEDSPLGLDKWLVTLWMIVNCKNGISSYEVAGAIGVTQKSAWFMLQRLRKALQDNDKTKLNGTIEVDESFIGGKARNMHLSKRRKVMEKKNRGGKSIALGFLERGGRLRTEVVDDRERPTLQGHVRNHVEPGSEVVTDELHSYWGLEKDFVHEVINHAAEYVNGHIHTNGLENFWSLVTKKRKVTNVERFAIALSQIAGKRLTYAEVTGQAAASS